MRTTTVAFLAAALTATPLLAQEPRPRPSPKQDVDKAQAAPEGKAGTDGRRDLPLVNVRVDVRIVDERGGQAATTKAVSLTVADRRDGFIRSSAEAPLGTKPENLRSVPLNVDVSPLIEGSRIRLGLGLEYNSIDSYTESRPYPRLELKQRLALVLEDGKTMRVAQSADPLSDRRISLDVTATILR